MLAVVISRGNMGSSTGRAVAIEAMVSSRHGNNASGFPQPREAIARLEMGHERLDAGARGRDVAAHGAVVLRPGTPFARRHNEFASGTADSKHCLRYIPIELAMEPADELPGRRLRQPTFGRDSIYLLLDADMRSRLELQIAAPFRPIEFAGQGTLDVARSRIVSFDEIAVVGVHDAYKVGQVGRGARG